MFRAFCFIALKTLNYLAFQSFNDDEHTCYLMKVIPETRRAQ